jgi:hypothetical protein
LLENIFVLIDFEALEIILPSFLNNMASLLVDKENETAGDAGQFGTFGRYARHILDMLRATVQRFRPIQRKARREGEGKGKEAEKGTLRANRKGTVKTRENKCSVLRPFSN